MKLLDYTKVKNNQSGVTVIALTVVVIMLGLLAGITLSIVTGDESLLKKTDQDAEKYNRQIQNYESEYENLTQRVDGRENQVDTLPGEF